MDNRNVITVFRLVQQAIHTIDTYPLHGNNLNLQQDAYKRLASIDDDDDEHTEIFASIEQSRKEKDGDLRFSFEFSHRYVVIHIEGLNSFALDYNDIAATDEFVAEQIIASMHMLANGQLACLHSARNGALCAVELIYQDRPGAAPQTLTIDASYTRFIGTKDGGEYDCHLFKNSYDIPLITMPDTFILRASLADNSPLVMNREFTGNTVTPLTRDAYKVIMNDISNTMAGVDDDAAFQKKIFRSPITWLTFIGIIVPVIIYLPDDIYPYTAPVIGLAAFFVASIIGTRAAMYLEKIRRTNADHRILLIQESLKGWTLVHLLYAIGSISSLISLTYPIYITKDTLRLVTLSYIAGQHGAWLLFGPTFGLLIALVISFARTRAMRIASAVLTTASIVGLFIINFSLTFTGDIPSTPEPYTSIALFSYMFVVILSVVHAYTSRTSKH